jgi:predicted O-methyltransferase YrrM
MLASLFFLQEYFAKGGHLGVVQLVVGPAMASLLAMQRKPKFEPFDLVFMDADKKAYRQYVERGSHSIVHRQVHVCAHAFFGSCLRACARYYDFLLGSGLLAPNALLLCDNVLFKGMVLSSTAAGKSKLLKGKKLNYWQRRHQVRKQSMLTS